MWTMLLISSALAGPVEFAPEAQVRPRAEANNGRDGAPGGGEIFISQRTRLGGLVAQGDVSVRVVVQDVRSWGEEFDTKADYAADNLDIYVGYATWQPTESVKAHVGRLVLPIHEQRLMSSNPWSQQERRFDGAHVEWKANDFSGDVAGLLLADSDTPANDGDALLGVMRAGWSVDGSQLDVLYLALSDTGRERLSHTAGVYTRGEAGIVSGRLESYVQAGRRDGGPVLGWMLGVKGTLAPEVESKPRFSLWYDHLSGESSVGNGVNNTFDLLFGSGHRFYGHMDVMAISVGGAQDLRGLQDLAVGFDVSPVEELRLGLDAHYFLPSAQLNGAANLGSEIDGTASVEVAKNLNLLAGGAVLFRPGAGEIDQLAYLMVDASLQTKKPR